MKMKKLFKVSALASVLALTLSGCGSPKNQLTEAYDNLAKAKSYEANIEMAISFENTTIADAQTQQLLNSVNGLTINVHSLVNNEQQQSEDQVSLNVSVPPLELALDILTFSDIKQGKSYVKSEAFIDMMNQIVPILGVPFTFELPEGFENTIIDMTATDTSLSEEQTEKLANDFKTKFNNLLQDLSKSKVEKDKNTYHFTISGEEIKSLFVDILIENMSVFGLEDVSVFEQLDETVILGDVHYTTSLNGSHVAKEEITIPISLNMNDESMSFKVKVASTYENYNTPVNFTFDLENSTIVSQDELMESMDSMFSNFGF